MEKCTQATFEEENEKAEEQVDQIADQGLETRSEPIHNAWSITPTKERFAIDSLTRWHLEIKIWDNANYRKSRPPENSISRNRGTGEGDLTSSSMKFQTRKRRRMKTSWEWLHSSWTGHKTCTRPRLRQNRFSPGWNRGNSFDLLRSRDVASTSAHTKLRSLELRYCLLLDIDLT